MTSKFQNHNGAWVRKIVTEQIRINETNIQIHVVANNLLSWRILEIKDNKIASKRDADIA